MAKQPKFISPSIESYLFEIGEIEPSYGFHVGHQRFEPGAFGENYHIQLTANCLRPRKLEGRTTNFTFIASREIITEIVARPANCPAPNGVGSLTMRGQQSEYLGTLPYDMACTLPLMISAGCYRFAYLSGPPIYRGSTRIQSVSFYRVYDPDDL